MSIFVPTQWETLCRSPRVETLDRRRLRVAMWGASPAPRPTLELMAATFPEAQIVSAYGQTEMSGATTLLKGADATRKMGSVGRAMLGVELRVVDDELRDVDPGAVGEVAYRGPTVMAGYHADPAATAEAFAGGWFHSGDLARLDEDGYLWLVDRKKDLIVSGGENVYPAEVERVLLEHASIADAAVVGVPHPRWVEAPLAFVVPVAGRRGRRGGRDRPLPRPARRPSRSRRRVVVVDELPRNAAGKVLKRRLRESLRLEAARERRAEGALRVDRRTGRRAVLAPARGGSAVLGPVLRRIRDSPTEFAGGREEFDDYMAQRGTPAWTHHVLAESREGRIETVLGQTRQDGRPIATFVAAARLDAAGRIDRYIVGRSPAVTFAD